MRHGVRNPIPGAPCPSYVSGLLDAVNCGDVGMIQRRQHAGFTLESRRSVAVMREGLRQNFDRDASPQFRVGGLIHVVERRDESITITRNGKPVAMIVSKDEYEGWHETSEILRDSEFLREIRDGIRSLARTRKRYKVDELFGM